LIFQTYSYGSDKAAFLSAYLEAKHGHSNLLAAIDQAHWVQGDLVA
jgi:hypothetical protein